LGKTGLYITPIGFGSWVLGGGGWTLHNPAVTAAIVGARNPAQVASFIGAMDFRLKQA